MHGSLRQETGLLTLEGKQIKNIPEILALLETLWLPQKVAITHCKGHQKGDSPGAVGNQMVPLAAREAALKPMGNIKTLTLTALPELCTKPSYSASALMVGESLTGGPVTEIENPSGQVHIPFQSPRVKIDYPSSQERPFKSLLDD